MNITVPSLDPNDEFDKVLLELKNLYEKKRADYSSGDRFSNFRYAGSFAGIEPYEAIEVLLGVKQARLQELNCKNPKNEPIRDTLIDRAVYSIIALMFYDSEKIK